MLDLTSYFALIPTGSSPVDSALKRYLTLLESWQMRGNYEPDRLDEARAALTKAEQEASLPEATRQEFHELMRKTAGLKPPSENPSDATGSKPLT